MPQSSLKRYRSIQIQACLLKEIRLYITLLILSTSAIEGRTVALKRLRSPPPPRAAGPASTELPPLMDSHRFVCQKERGTMPTVHHLQRIKAGPKKQTRAGFVLTPVILARVSPSKLCRGGGGGSTPYNLITTQACSHIHVILI